MDGALSAADVGTSTSTIDGSAVGVERKTTKFAPPRRVGSSAQATFARVTRLGRRRARPQGRVDALVHPNGWSSATSSRRPSPPRRRSWSACRMALSVDHYNDHYLIVSLLLPLFWVASMALSGAYDERILGIGPEEFQRSLRGVHRCHRRRRLRSPTRCACTWLAATSSSRCRSRSCCPPSAATGSASRCTTPAAAGRFRTDVVAVGDADSVADLAMRMHDELHIGMRVVGACIPAPPARRPGRHRDRWPAPTSLPLGDLDSVVTAVNRSRADTVAVTSSRDIGPRRLRELSWELESTAADLVVAPGLIEVAGPRMHIRPVIGLPLLQIEKPEFTGGRRLLKGFVDRSSGVDGHAHAQPAADRHLLRGAPQRLRSGVLPPDPRRQGRQGVPHLEVPLDVRRRRGPPRRDPRPERERRRPAVQDARRPAGHAGRTVHPALLPGRAAAAVQRAQRHDVARRARARRCRPRWPSTASTFVAACWSARGSPASGRSAAAATCRGKSRCVSTCATSRTGPWARTR